METLKWHESHDSLLSPYVPFKGRKIRVSCLDLGRVGEPLFDSLKILDVPEIGLVWADDDEIVDNLGLRRHGQSSSSGIAENCNCQMNMSSEC